MSHIKNLQAFEKLTGLCTGYGGAYNPGQQNLQVEALITRLHNAQQCITAVALAQNSYNRQSNIRELCYEEVKKLTSHMISVLKSTDGDALTLEDARSLACKIRRETRSKLKEAVAEGEPPPKYRRGSGGDYASIAVNFARLITLVGDQVAYQPNEPGLKLAALEQKLVELKEASERVMLAEIQLMLERKKRNETMYLGADSLSDTLKLVKAYVRGVFGFMSSEHEKISRLNFKPAS